MYQFSPGTCEKHSASQNPLLCSSLFCLCTGRSAHDQIQTEKSLHLVIAELILHRSYTKAVLTFQNC